TGRTGPHPASRHGDGIPATGHRRRSGLARTGLVCDGWLYRHVGEDTGLELRGSCIVRASRFHKCPYRTDLHHHAHLGGATWPCSTAAPNWIPPPPPRLAEQWSAKPPCRSERPSSVTRRSTKS